MRQGDLSVYDPAGANPTGLPGTIDFNMNGTGVRGFAGMGSGGISGLGGFGGEALVMSFSTPIITNQTVITFPEYALFGSTPYLYLDDTIVPILFETEIEPAPCCYSGPAWAPSPLRRIYPGHSAREV